MDGRLADLGHAEVPSPLGPLWLAFAGPTLLHLDFADNAARIERLFARRFPARVLASAALPLPLGRALESYFAGEVGALRDVPCQTGGSVFQRDVWRLLRTVPAGETSTYGALAKQVQRPGASRAVGAAVGANPISIVVPCHRIVGANGRLTGYAGGLDRKRWLLAHENAAV